MKSRSAMLALAVCLLAGTAAAQAEEYPSHTVNVVVAFPPGGSADVIGRVVAQALSKQMKQAFVVENRSGFGGNVGVRYASKAPKDGYTLLLCSCTAASISVSLSPEQTNYNLETDFAMISMLGKAPLALVVNNDVPAKTLADFIALAKQKPGQITFSSAGVGTTQHLGGELFKLMTGTKLVHVPYKGSGPSMTDLLGGQVQSTFETGPAIAPFLRNPGLRIIAYANETRTPTMPDVPTATEAGLPGFNVAATYGLMAPVGTPKEIVDRLNAEVKAALELPEVKATFAQQGLEATYTTSPQMAAQIHAEIAKWAKVVKDAGVKPE
jgi:tripartite-type tricarboxylate transporter receptor subunit TctC